MTHRLTVLGVVCGLALAALPGAAVAGGLPSLNTDCVVQSVDERGDATGTTRVREGSVYGQFRCVSGQWELTRSPFDRGDAITSREIQVDRAGNVSARQIVGPALGYGLTLAEMARIVQVIGGEAVVFDKAVVAADDGRERTQEEIRALLAGEDTTGVRVLDVIDRPDAAMSVNDIIGAAGGTPETAVVYFSIWGAIKSAFAWIVDWFQETGPWSENHCIWVVAPPPDFGYVIVCQW